MGPRNAASDPLRFTVRTSPLPPPLPGDRRRHARVAAARPCKVFRESTCRYTAATTRDVSAGGVLLELQPSRPILPGERLGVGIAWTGAAILSDTAMIDGVVVRVEDLDDDRQSVAVRFSKAEPLALAT